MKHEEQTTLKVFEKEDKELQPVTLETMKNIESPMERAKAMEQYWAWRKAAKEQDKKNAQHIANKINYAVNKEYIKEYHKEYWKREEVIEKRKKYITTYYSKPEKKEMQKERLKIYYNKPETKIKLKEYYNRPEVKAKYKERARIKYQEKKAAKLAVKEAKNDINK